MLISLAIRKIHIKTTLRFHINLVRMAINNRSESQFGRRCGKTGTLSVLMGVQFNTTFVEKVRISLKQIKNSFSIILHYFIPVPNCYTSSNSFMDLFLGR